MTLRIIPNDEDIEMMISKFIINLPSHQMKEDRIWIHLEKMFHYFIDEVVDLEPLSDFQLHDREVKEFFALIVQKLPTFLSYLKLDSNKILKMINDGYSNTPVFGVIIFNLEQTKILLVESHKPAGMYGIPKGKINEGQTPLECACREVKEEVGINVELNENYKIEVFYSKNCCFYMCKIQENNINVLFNKNTSMQKLKGKKKTSKEIKSLVWLELRNPSQLRLNVATKKAIDKIKSQQSMRGGNKLISSGNNNGQNGRANGCQENGRSNNHSSRPSQQTIWRQECPFDCYKIKNRRTYQMLFEND